MATTDYLATAARVLALQARTDDSGADIVDVTGADLRTVTQLWTAGVIGADDLKPAPVSGMKVAVGAGASHGNLAIVAGSHPGQGNYLVAVDRDKVEIALAAADLTHDRIDEIYLAVQDDAYDSSGRTIARIAVRQGTATATPAVPGPDPTWTAHLPIAQIRVSSAVTAITSAEITDKRTHARALVESVGAAKAKDLTAHTANRSNPHHVTAAQAGALTQKTADGRYAPKSHTHPYLTQHAADIRYYTKTGAAATFAPKNHTHGYLTQHTADARYAPKSHDHDRLYVSGQHGARKVTISSGGPPASGSDGDIHLQFV